MGRHRPQPQPKPPTSAIKPLLCKCGATPKLEQYKAYTNDLLIRYRVICTNPECHKTGPIYPSTDDAVRGWNNFTRTGEYLV